MSDEAWDALTPEQKDAWVKREADYLIHTLEFIEAGLAVRRAGLIWFLPLCHDSYGEGNG